MATFPGCEHTFVGIPPQPAFLRCRRAVRRRSRRDPRACWMRSGAPPCDLWASRRQADYRIRGHDKAVGLTTALYRAAARRDAEPLSVVLNMPGSHNVLNATAAIAVSPAMRAWKTRRSSARSRRLCRAWGGASTHSRRCSTLPGRQLRCWWMTTATIPPSCGRPWSRRARPGRSGAWSWSSSPTVQPHPGSLRRLRQCCAIVDATCCCWMSTPLASEALIPGADCPVSLCRSIRQRGPLSIPIHVGGHRRRWRQVLAGHSRRTATCC